MYGVSLLGEEEGLDVFIEGNRNCCVWLERLHGSHCGYSTTTINETAASGCAQMMYMHPPPE